MGRCESSFDMTACQTLVHLQFQKKNQPIDVLVCVIRTRAHLLFLFFFLSQHVNREVEKSQPWTLSSYTLATGRGLFTNYACGFSQSETERYFEWIIILHN